MWIFTDQGFVSAVAFDPTKDTVKRSKRQVKGWGKNPILVRARLRDDIEQIRPYWSKLLIEEDDSADYEFRAIVPRTRWTDFMAHKASEIDYPSHFKEVAQSRSPNGAAEGLSRHTAMMKVWTAMAALQPHTPYSGNEWYKTYKYTGAGATGYTEYWTTDGKNKGIGGLCDCYMEFTRLVDGKDKTFRQWCNLTRGHIVDHKMSAEVAVESSFKMSYGRKIFSVKDNTNTAPKPVVHADPVTEAKIDLKKPYDPTNPFDMADTVESMCKALMEKRPDDVEVDPATPYATYDLWARALEEFHEPLTAEEILDILDELIEDYATVQEAKDEYTAAAHKFVAGVYTDALDIMDAEVVEDDFNALSNPFHSPEYNSQSPLDVDEKLLKQYDEVIDMGHELYPVA